MFLEWLNAPKNLKWIEVGCGNGAFTEELIAHCAPLEVTAVDPSEGQLSFARTRQATKLAQFRQADAQALPFPDRSFDAAAMALVITFIPDPAKAVAEMARVVRPGGMIATYMWDTPAAAFRSRRSGAPSSRWARNTRARAAMRPGARSCRRFGRRAGLQLVESREIRIP